MTDEDILADGTAEESKQNWPQSRRQPPFREQQILRREPQSLYHIRAAFVVAARPKAGEATALRSDAHFLPFRLADPVGTRGVPMQAQ